MAPGVELYDTTLRDGTQGENISFTAEEKIEIARRLDRLGIDYIEGGWPGSNPRDMSFFRQARDLPFQHSRLVAFGATRRPGLTAAEDPNLRALVDARTPAVAIFGKTWDLHVTDIMGLDLSENLAMIRDSVAYLKAAGLEVIYDAEHFFDGYRENADYALATIQTAVNAGADAVVLCDTNGGALPATITPAVVAVRNILAGPGGDGAHSAVRIGIHAHNDCNLAVANTLAAMDGGATMIHGTINGYGERCGNADLTSLIPILCVKLRIACVSDEQLTYLKKLSRFVSETANIVPLNSRPFVGESAFAHKGGIHVSAVIKEPRGYEHMTPERVGNRRRVLVSDLSGKSNIEYKAKELGVSLGDNQNDTRAIVEKVKQLEQNGYQFDVADGSLKILLEKFTNQFVPQFELESFRVAMEKDKGQPCHAHATVKINVGGMPEITAAEGKGPVSALDNALRKALNQFYPGLADMRLVDFKVRVIDGRDGTSARVRVLIESRDHEDIWHTIGVSEDIIEASWTALTDSFQYKLAKDLNPAAENTGG